MNDLIHSFSQYMLKNLNLQLSPKPWNGKNKLPIFLQNFYLFFDVSLLGKICLLVVPKEEVMTPSVIRKHLLHLQKISGFPCIYVTCAISSYNRQRLMKHGVQFVIPGRQIYLPGLGLNWNERFIQGEKNKINKRLSPSAQTVVIYVIMHEKKRFTPLELARILNYTPMTMTRALNELEAFGIGTVEKKGKERFISFVQHLSKVWTQALPFMQNPVKKRVWIRADKQKIDKIKNQSAIAGLSALAEISMLSDPLLPIYAIGLSKWKYLEQSRNIEIIPNSDGAEIELEVWSYDPLLFSEKKYVDRLSLYLSLRDVSDDRVEAALEKILKEIKW